MNIKVTLCGRDTKTTVSQRTYRLRNYRDLNDNRFMFFYHNNKRLNMITREFDSSMTQNTNGYRKLIDTYFEPHD